jgi:hypothetical protein
MGWWKTDFDISIGDEPADIVGSGLEALLAECQLRIPGFTEDQFMATVSFVAGGIPCGYSLDLAQRGLTELPMDYDFNSPTAELTPALGSSQTLGFPATEKWIDTYEYTGGELLKVSRLTTDAPDMELDELVQSIKAEIMADIRDDILPRYVGSFEELNDSVDAWEYGDLTNTSEDLRQLTLAEVNYIHGKIDYWLQGQPGIEE